MRRQTITKHNTLTCSASEREARFIEEHRASMLWKLRCKSHPNSIIHETFLMGPRCITPLMENSSTHYKETTQFTRELQERPTQKPSKWMGDTPTKVAQQHQRNNKNDSKKLPQITPGPLLLTLLGHSLNLGFLFDGFGMPLDPKWTPRSTPRGSKTSSSGTQMGPKGRQIPKKPALEGLLNTNPEFHQKLSKF